MNLPLGITKWKLKMIKKLNYFSDEEQNSQSEFAKKRTKILKPILSLVDSLGLTPDGISYFALSLLIPFTIFFKAEPIFATLCLMIYVLLDGLDGALARFKGSDNLGGSLTDIVVDQVGLVVIVGNLIYHGMTDPTISYYYGILYIVMISFSVVQNALEIPMQRLVRSKYVIYLIYIIHSIPYLGNLIQNAMPTDLIYDIAFILFTLIMLITNIISYKRLKNYFSNIK